MTDAPKLTAEQKDAILVRHARNASELQFYRALSLLQDAGLRVTRPTGEPVGIEWGHVLNCVQGPIQ